SMRSTAAPNQGKPRFLNSAQPPCRCATTEGACMEEARHFIGGEWCAASGGETIAVLDPSDGQPFTRLARGTAADIDTAVHAARLAFEGAWGAASAAE